jgi:hypothetical protein
VPCSGLTLSTCVRGCYWCSKKQGHLLGTVSVLVGSGRGSMDWSARRTGSPEGEAQSSPPNPQMVATGVIQIPVTTSSPRRQAHASSQQQGGQSSSSPRSSSTATGAPPGGAQVPPEKMGESQPIDQAVHEVTSIDDANRNLVTETRTESIVFGSSGEASMVFPSQLHISTEGGIPSSLVTIPRTPFTTPSGSSVPSHLQAEFM